jgi:methionyl-tRNA synthetase
MSKSRGTFIRARTYLEAGLNPEYLRYYFAAKSSGGVDDLDLNLEDFVQRVNSDLVGKFVNIASRCAGFLTKRFDGRLSQLSAGDQLLYKASYDKLANLCLGASGAYAQGNFIATIRAVMAEADAANELIAERAPWQLAKSDDQVDRDRLHRYCSLALNQFRLLAGFLAPILPQTARRAAEILNTSLDRFEALAEPLIDHSIQPYQALLTRVDPKQIEAMVETSKESLQPQPAKPVSGQIQAQPAKEPSSAVTNHESQVTNHISITDFAKLDLRIGKVLECTFVEGSDKLLRFLLDAGELGQRQIFSGIRASYAEPEKLVGRNVVFIANLAARKMRFGVSEGMILSAGFDGGGLFLLDTDAGAAAGMPVR